MYGKAMASSCMSDQACWSSALTLGRRNMMLPVCFCSDFDYRDTHLPVHMLHTLHNTVSGKQSIPLPR